MGKAAQKQEGFILSKDDRGRDVIAPVTMQLVSETVFQPPAVSEPEEDHDHDHDRTPKKPFVNPLTRFADFIIDSGEERRWARLHLMAPVIGVMVISLIIGFVRLVNVYPKIWAWLAIGVVGLAASWAAGWVAMWLIAIVRDSTKGDSDSDSDSGGGYYGC